MYKKCCVCIRVSNTKILERGIGGIEEEVDLAFNFFFFLKGSDLQENYL